MKLLKGILTALTFILLTGSAEAAPLKILFFYPGGQGTQELAQPLLDSFSEALKKSSGGKIESSVFYISDLQQGLQYIKTEKPAAGILSLDTFNQYGNSWAAKVIAKTLQLPSGDGTNQYFLMGKAGQQLPTSGNLQILSPQLLDPKFVVGKLLPNLKNLEISIQNTQNVMGELRAIGQGKKEGWVLLDQFEYANISHLKTPWISGLEVVAKSNKVSSAPFVVFEANIPIELVTELQNALLKLGADASAQETLSNLRIKGFQKASSAE
jgi:phosphonate ABC transporter substrate-binding protein